MKKIFIFSMLMFLLLLLACNNKKQQEYAYEVPTAKELSYEGEWELLLLTTITRSDTAKIIASEDFKVNKIISKNGFENVAVAKGIIHKYSGNYKLINDSIYIEYITKHPITKMIGDSIVYKAFLLESSLMLETIKKTESGDIKVIEIYSRK